MAAQATTEPDLLTTPREARGRLVLALREAAGGLRDEEPAALDALLAHLGRDLDPPPGGPGAASWLQRRLVAFAAANPRAFGPLADLLGHAARGLAATGAPPTDGAGLAAWRATLATTERLYGGGWRRLGRPPFLDGVRLERLLAEARRVRHRTVAVARRVADPGPALRELAADRRLAAAVSEALGVAVAPGDRAVYLDLAPGARVEPHVDGGDFEVSFHLTLAHDPPPDAPRRAALVVFRADERPERIELAPGEALALRGRGTVHARERLAPDERWTALAIGFVQTERRR
jgi:hypothetical protein